MRHLFPLIMLLAVPATAEDWPMWRCDAGRTAHASQEIKMDLKLKWSRELPRLEPAYRDNRLQFDAGYEPIAFGNRIFVSSSFDGSVTAFDSDSGAELWKFYTDGPVRFAPVGGGGRVIFGSDDGWIYCVRASQGDLVWKQKAVPLERKLIGNGQLISVWPIRGGPVLYEEKVYFAAGVWPLEGVFVYCLDAATGQVVWLNDSSSYIYGQHPHDTEAFGGLAPQGYLLVDGDDLVVPCSNAYPARFDIKTGKLKEFKLPTPGRFTGGWFAASRPEKETRRGEVVFDRSVNQKRHEDKMREEGISGIRGKISVKGKDLNFLDGYPGVEGQIYSMVVADGNLIITTEEGKIYCFGDSPEAAKIHGLTGNEEKLTTPDNISRLLRKIGKRKGYAVVFDDNATAAESIARQSSLQVIAVQPVEIDERIRDMSSAKLSYRVGEISQYVMPPYFADFVMLNSPTVQGTMSDSTGYSRLKAIYESVRPFGGVLVLPKSFEALISTENLPGAVVEATDPDYLFITRSGALKGSTDYLGDWSQSPDDLVKAPFGVLWFGDQVSHFKRAPQPRFVNGVMISLDKDWTDASTRKGKVDYRLLPPKFTDVYTGRPLEADEVPELRQSFSEFDAKTVQPSQYRPPQQVDDWKPDAPKAGLRVNPLTGEEEARTFPKMYGCDGGMDYGHLYTMRSGTAAFYDLRNDSGTVNVSGPRSGCTNSIIPANGVLNLPYFYEGCTCSYPLPMGLSLISMPETFEQWMSWGAAPADSLKGKIQRLGINFGAPGDRRTDDGTLWLDFPERGGPSPTISVVTDPAEPDYVYHHSLWMQVPNGTWPWVAGSAATNLKAITISGFKKGSYVLRLTFSRFNDSHIAKVPVEVTIQNQTESFPCDLKAMSALTKSFRGIEISSDLSLKFSAETCLSGIEILPDETK